jgi:hypothetical protein
MDLTRWFLTLAEAERLPTSPRDLFECRGAAFVSSDEANEESERINRSANGHEDPKQR